MFLRSEALLDHIADFLKFIPSTQLFWFTLNTSYDHGCHLASCFRLDPEDYDALLIVAGLASYTRFGFQIKAMASLLSHHCLSLSSCCAAHSSSRPARWLLRPLLTHRPLVFSSSRHAASHFLVAPAGCCIIISHRPLVAPPSRPLIVISTTMARESRASGGMTTATGGGTMGGTTQHRYVLEPAAAGTVIFRR